MNRTHTDGLVVLLVLGLLTLGGYLTLLAFSGGNSTGMNGHMSSITMGHGVNPAWYGLLMLVLVVAIVGVYLGIRDSIPDQAVPPPSATDAFDDGGDRTGFDVPPRPVLDVLPEDERRVLEPVIESPGLTQIALRDRSEFSKSKVSQTVTELEKRGLLYRERQGRTYRIYPDDDLLE